MGLGHGAIMSAATLERPRLASSPPGTLCIRRETRTPLVVSRCKPSAQVLDVPRGDPAAHSFLITQTCLTRRLTITPRSRGVPRVHRRLRYPPADVSTAWDQIRGDARRRSVRSASPLKQSSSGIGDWFSDPITRRAGA